MDVFNDCGGRSWIYNWGFVLALQKDNEIVGKCLHLSVFQQAAFSLSVVSWYGHMVVLCPKENFWGEKTEEF